MAKRKDNYYYLWVSRTGYGQYRITTRYYGKDISCHSTNAPAVDDFNSDEFEKDGRELRRKRGYRYLRNECISKNK